MENLNVNEEVINEVLISSKQRRTMFQQQAFDRMGETRLNNYGSLMTVDEYRNSNDITVRFIESGYMVDTTYHLFSKGQIKQPYDKSVFGVGYIGEGSYKITENGVLTQQYRTWVEMIRRCYSENFQSAHPTYKGVTVCEEWLNFQNFCDWFKDNHYEIKGKKTNLDKDILVRGNKIYSPNTCVFAPQNINVIFTKREALRGDLPIGVRLMGNKYQAQCAEGTGKQTHLGLFETPEQAFEVYKEYKEAYIKKVAKDYKDEIPNSLYEALMNYTVQIDD